MLAPLFQNNITLPAMVAPLFLLSGPKLVIACAKAGIPAAFPSLNHRTSEGFSGWLDEINQALLDSQTPPAPYGVNLIVHPTNKRLEADLEVIIKAKVPYVITSLGSVPDIVSKIHDYGGIVLHDVINTKHAQKAMAANVDGLIAVSSGAGGHAGTTHPFALLSELKPIIGDKMLVLSGSITTGGDIAAAISAGADLAYMGTRFIATKESQAQDDYKDMIVRSEAKDIVYTNKISGVHGNFMAESLQRAGIDLNDLNDLKRPKMNLNDEAKVWSDIWSAGHGVSAIDTVLPAAELIGHLKEEFKSAQTQLNKWT